MALVALWAIVMGARGVRAPGATATTATATSQIFGANAGEGRLFSADKWESGADRRRVARLPEAARLDLRSARARRPHAHRRDVLRERAGRPQPRAGGNFTIAAGNLAEISAAAPDQVVVHNGTCADYFLRVVVEAAAARRRTPHFPSPIPDAGGDAEAGP